MSNNQIVEGLKVIEGIVKAVPVYEDALQPAAKQIGKGLETITKAINIALFPVSSLVWGYEKIESYLSSRLTEKLQKVPPERIITPNILVAGPLLESLRFAANEEILRELYANLLATSIDSETAQNAHPAFVEILRSLSPDEARILRFFATGNGHPLIDIKAMISPQGFSVRYRNFSFIGEKASCEYQNLTPNYLDNLCRLGLLEIPTGRYILSDGLYEALESDKQLDQIKENITATEGWTVGFDRKKIELTDLGKQFCMACIIEKNIIQ